MQLWRGFSTQENFKGKSQVFSWVETLTGFRLKIDFSTSRIFQRWHLKSIIAFKTLLQHPRRVELLETHKWNSDGWEKLAGNSLHHHSGSSVLAQQYFRKQHAEGEGRSAREAETRWGWEGEAWEAEKLIKFIEKFILSTCDVAAAVADCNHGVAGDPEHDWASHRH